MKLNELARPTSSRGEGAPACSAEDSREEVLADADVVEAPVFFHGQQRVLPLERRGVGVGVRHRRVASLLPLLPRAIRARYRRPAPSAVRPRHRSPLSPVDGVACPVAADGQQHAMLDVTSAAACKPQRFRQCHWRIEV